MSNYISTAIVGVAIIGFSVSLVAFGIGLFAGWMLWG